MKEEFSIFWLTFIIDIFTVNSVNNFVKFKVLGQHFESVFCYKYWVFCSQIDWVCVDLNQNQIGGSDMELNKILTDENSSLNWRLICHMCKKCYLQPATSPMLRLIFCFRLDSYSHFKDSVEHNFCSYTSVLLWLLTKLALHFNQVINNGNLDR